MFKKLAVVLVVLFTIGGTASAFAWWDNLEQTKTETITIGAGETLEVEAVLVYDDTKNLIPAGAVLKVNDVNEVVLTYNVKLDQAAVNDLNLGVSVSDVKVGGVTYTGSLVNIVVSNPVENTTVAVNDTAVVVTVTVTLAPDAESNDYSTIINKDISFVLTFTATQ